MSEHLPHASAQPEREQPHGARPENNDQTLTGQIEAGITSALEQKREVSLDTAIDIAKALSHMVGDDSMLARFADTAKGNYFALREEYLSLYGASATVPEVRRWIDWLGAFLVEREHIGSGRRFMNENIEPDLERILVRTFLPSQAGHAIAHLPATLDAANIIALTARLEAVDEFQEASFKAFLTLPDVNAADTNLLESYRETHAGTFRRPEDALYTLTPLQDWDTALENWAADQGLRREAVQINLDIIEETMRDTYDIVERDGYIHAFHK